MRHYTPTNHPQGVKVLHLSHEGDISFCDPWDVIDRIPSSVDGSRKWFITCSFSDAGVSFGHDEVTAYSPAWNRRGVSWSHVPTAVRHAIIADHPEWLGTVWTV